MAKSPSQKVHETWLQREAFFSHVGQGISTWTKMEMSLVAIFSLLLGIPLAKGGLILYSIINFNTWLTLITDLFASDEKLKPLSARWNKKAERLRALNDTRTRLAHHTIWMDEQDVATLRPTHFDTRPKSQAYLPLTSADIVAFTEEAVTVVEEFNELIQAMMNIRHGDAPVDQSR